MGIKVLNDLDMNQNQTQKNVIHKLSTAPSNPIAGQEYYNTTNNTLYYYNGTKWIPLKEAQDISTMSTQATSLTCTLPDDL